MGRKAVSHCEVFCIEERVSVLQFNRNLCGWPKLKRAETFPAIIDILDIEGNVDLNKFQRSKSLL